METSDLNLAFSRKVRAGFFAPVLCGVSAWHDADDRAQEGLCQTWLTYLRHFEATGEFLTDGALLAQCRRRCRSRRDSFVPRGRRGRWSLDVFDAIERRRELGTLTSADTVALPSADAASPEEGIHVAGILSRLDPMDREVVIGLLAGETTREIGRSAGTSSATVSRQVARLRRRLASVAHG